jgi:hypothetical protein
MMYSTAAKKCLEKQSKWSQNLPKSHKISPHYGKISAERMDKKVLKFYTHLRQIISLVLKFRPIWLKPEIRKS